MKNIVDESVNKILNESYQRVRGLLMNHKTTIERIAEELMVKETLTRDEILSIAGISTDK
jgi:cell division protease FtsH